MKCTHCANPARGNLILSISSGEERRPAEEIDVKARQRKTSHPPALISGSHRTMEQFYVNIRKKGGGYINPFLLSKIITQTIGPLLTAKNTPEGLLTKLNKDQIDKLNGIKTGEIDIEAVLNEAKNTSKGTIFFPELKYSEDDEIIEELSDQGVYKVERILKRGSPALNEKGTKEGLRNTGLFILHFKKSSKPAHINICFIRVVVNTYYPSVFYCSNCHQLGHKKPRCSNPKKCGKCSNDHHDTCDDPTKCINCGGEHPAWNKECPAYQHETKVIRYAIDNNVPFTEARRRLQTSAGLKNIAQAVKQTEEIEALKQEITRLQKQNEELLKMTSIQLQSNNNNTSKVTTATKKSSSKTPAQDLLDNMRKKMEESRTTTSYEDLESSEEMETETISLGKTKSRKNSISPSKKKTKT